VFNIKQVEYMILTIGFIVIHSNISLLEDKQY
jgi:hypothetical protein